MHISVRMTFNIILDFCDAQLCTNDYPYSFRFLSCTSLYERLSIYYSCMGFRHSYICTNDYPHSCWFLSCTSLYEWLSILLWVFVMHIFVRMNIHILVVFCHAHLCTNAYPYCYGFLSCTFCTNDYPYLVFVIHMFVRMTIQIIMVFCHAHLCTKDYFVPNFFPLCFCKTVIVSY